MGRWWRVVLVSAALVLAAFSASLGAVAVNVATGGSAGPLVFLERHPWWWVVGSSVVVAAAGALVWWSQRRYDRWLEALVPAARRVA